VKKKAPPPIAESSEPKTDRTPDAASKVERAIVSNILQKIQKGGTPTTRQTEMLRQFFDQSGKSGAVWVRAFPELGEILGCHRTSFARWRRTYDDCPKARSDGWHNVDQWRAWINAHPQIKAAPDVGVEKQQLELEELRQKVRKAVHLNDVRQQQFTRNEIFADWITRIVTEAKGLLRQKFEFELPAYTAHQESAVIRLLNKRAIDEVCARLSELSKAPTI
jgi:hypothetical protein